MKQVFLLLLCCIMLFTAACGRLPDSSAEPTDVTQTQNSLPAEIPQEDEVPELPTLPVRENPVSKRKEADIEVFGSVPGVVISKSGDLDFLNGSFDLNRLLFDGDRVSFSAELGTYLVDGYAEKTEQLMQAIETITGLPFADAAITVILGDAGNRHSDFDYVGGADAENRIVQIGQGDAFLGHGFELVSYLAAVLQWDHAPQQFVEVLDSGFITYAAYDVLSQLERSEPEFSSAFASSLTVYANYYIYDPDVLYSNPLSFWMENEYPYTQTNGNPAVGFWLMNYLDHVYGDYTKWITAYDASNGTLDLEGQIQLLKDAYGETVLDGFYPWLQENLGKHIPWEMVPDHTALQKYVCYPFLTNLNIPQELLHGTYTDICICLTQYRHYLTQVKAFTIDALTMIKYSDVEVALYDAEGKFLEATRGTQAEDGTYCVCLDNAYYVRFLEDGYLYALLDLEYAYP